jgi:sulfite exporter TauE/SafE
MGETLNIVYLAFTLGLLANFHCIGMCGPISLALPLNRTTKLTAASGVMTYTFGRSIGYAMLGVIIGAIGFSANLLGALQWLSIVSGILIILFAWRNYYAFTPRFTAFNHFVSQKIGVLFKRNREKKSYTTLGLIGLLNAYLPCGMVYVALLSALNAGSVTNAALFMFVFGLGTAPGFLMLALLKNKMTYSRFFTNKVLVASLVSIVGLLILLRGLNLGIPMISPKMEMTQTIQVDDNETHIEEKAVMSCCAPKEDVGLDCETLKDNH